MRFLYGIVAFIVWVVFLVTVFDGGKISPDAEAISLAIIIAGVLAGGDGK